MENKSNVFWKRSLAASSLLLLTLTGCSSINSESITSGEGKKPTIEKNIPYDNSVMAVGFSEVPTGWSYSTMNHNPRNTLTNEKNSCSVSVSSAKVPYSGLGLGDSFITNLYAQDTYSQFKDVTSPALGKLEISKMPRGTAEFLTYEFDGMRDVGNAETPDYKKSRNFVAVRGFDSPIEDKQWNSVAVVESYCNDFKDYDKNALEQVIKLAQFDEVPLKIAN